MMKLTRCQDIEDKFNQPPPYVQPWLVQFTTTESDKVELDCVVRYISPLGSAMLVGVEDRDKATNGVLYILRQNLPENRFNEIRGTLKCGDVLNVLGKLFSISPEEYVLSTTSVEPTGENLNETRF